MEPISVLGSLMGLSFVSGLRLYSAVLAVGLGLRFGYLVAPPHLDHLAILGNSFVLSVAAFCYTCEFVADKIPWVDTLWDTVHTIIRPIGAAVVGATAIGAVDPVVTLGVFLLCGGIGFSSHSAKATTRILVNHSPEPFSNIGLSLAEDAAVVGGVWLAFNHPLISLVVATIAVGFAVWLARMLTRMIRDRAAQIGAAGKRYWSRTSRARNSP